MGLSSPRYGHIFRVSSLLCGRRARCLTVSAIGYGACFFGTVTAVGPFSSPLLLSVQADGVHSVSRTFGRCLLAYTEVLVMGDNAVF